MCIPPNTEEDDMEDWEQNLLIVDLVFVIIFTLESLAYISAMGCVPPLLYHDLL